MKGAGFIFSRFISFGNQCDFVHFSTENIIWAFALSMLIEVLNGHTYLTVILWSFKCEIACGNGCVIICSYNLDGDRCD